MSAEQVFAGIGRSIDVVLDAVVNAFTAIRRSEETIWRAHHHGEAADAIGEYPAYRTAVITITRAATTDTRTELQAALRRARHEARTQTDAALDRFHRTTTHAPHPEGGS